MDYRIDELSRFRLLLAGLTASLALSAFYGFNLISGHLEVTYGFDASDLTTITTCGIVVGFLTFPAGILLDYAGPMYVLIISTSISALGALLFGLSFGGFITGSVVRFSIFCALFNFGCTWFDSGSLMAVLGSFPLTRGLVVALMKTLAGLGASLLAMINYSFFREKYAAYMYFIAIYLTIFGAVSIALIRFPPYHIVDLEKKTLPLEIQERRRLIEPFYLKQYPPMRRFFLGCAIILTMIIYLTAQSLSVAFLPSVGDQTRLGLTIGVLILTCSLVFIAAPFPFLGGMSHTPNEELPPLPSNEADAEDKPKGGDSELVEEDGNEMTANSNVDPQYQGTFWQDLKTLDLWLVWWNALVAWSCGLIVSFNSAQTYRALNNGEYDTAFNSMYSAIIGIGNALGRFLLGLVEVMIVRRPPDNRPTITCLYPIASCSLALSMIFFLILPLRSKALILPFFLGGFGNGAAWATTALVVRGMYAKDIGKHYNFLNLAALVGAITLNRFAYGEQYTREAKKRPDLYPKCAGKGCVKNAFIILLSLCITAIAASVIVHVRFSRFVKKTRAERMSNGTGPHADLSDSRCHGNELAVRDD